jgi:hypothetical protein
VAGEDIAGSEFLELQERPSLTHILLIPGGLLDILAQ